MTMLYLEVLEAFSLANLRPHSTSMRLSIQWSIGAFLKRRLSGTCEYTSDTVTENARGLGSRRYDPNVAVIGRKIPHPVLISLRSPRRNCSDRRRSSG